MGANPFGGGAVAVGPSGVIEISFVGRGSTEDHGRAHMVQHLLSHFSRGSELLVRCNGLRQQLDLVSKSSGFVAGGDKPFSGFDILKPIQDARERGEWVLEGKPSLSDAKRAKDLAVAGMDEIGRLVGFLPTSLDHFPEHHLLWSSDGLVKTSKVFW